MNWPRQLHDVNTPAITRKQGKSTASKSSQSKDGICVLSNSGGGHSQFIVVRKHLFVVASNSLTGEAVEESPSLAGYDKQVVGPIRESNLGETANTGATRELPRTWCVRVRQPFKSFTELLLVSVGHRSVQWYNVERSSCGGERLSILNRPTCSPSFSMMMFEQEVVA